MPPGCERKQNVVRVALASLPWIHAMGLGSSEMVYET